MGINNTSERCRRIPVQKVHRVLPISNNSYKKVNCTLEFDNGAPLRKKWRCLRSNFTGSLQSTEAKTGHCFLTNNEPQPHSRLKVTKRYNGAVLED